MREKNLTHLDADILISAGLFGYSQARKRFDPSRDVKFKTFAEYRIKGAVLDEVRKMIGDERCKNPRPKQVDYDFARVGDDGECVETMESKLAVDGFWDTLRLSKRDKKILECRVKGMNLREIGKEFGFSESRASQILADIKRQIYPSFQKHLGKKIRLVKFRCPACKHPNEQSERAVGFDCERCDSTVEIKAGVPMLKDLELSEKGE